MTVVKREAKTSSSVNVLAGGSECFQADRENCFRINLYGKNMKVLEEDQESSGSSEDTDSNSSPRSVVQLAKGRRWPSAGKSLFPVRLHSQVLRIREEDSFIGDDVFGEYCLTSTTAMEDHKDDMGAAVTIFSNKPSLPASPLGGKAAIKLMQ